MGCVLVRSGAVGKALLCCYPLSLVLERGGNVNGCDIWVELPFSDVMVGVKRVSSCYFFALVRFFSGVVFAGVIVRCVTALVYSGSLT